MYNSKLIKDLRTEVNDLFAKDFYIEDIMNVWEYDNMNNVCSFFIDLCKDKEDNLFYTLSIVYNDDILYDESFYDVDLDCINKVFTKALEQAIN